MFADLLGVESNRQRFVATYRTKLAAAMAAHPEGFTYSASRIGQVADRIAEAAALGLRIESRGPLQETCAQLGIKNDREALRAFLAS